MTHTREIYDIEPDGDLNIIKARMKVMDSEFFLYHIGVEGGNEEFYDKQGSRPLKDVVNFLKGDLGFSLMHVVNRFGDVYVVTKEKPEVEKVQTVMEDGGNLEVKLVISEVKVE
jgi:hypothetical protein